MCCACIGCCRSNSIQPGNQTAVSYTHLDVYKRQDQVHAAVQAAVEGEVGGSGFSIFRADVTDLCHEGDNELRCV